MKKIPFLNLFIGAGYTLVLLLESLGMIGHLWRRRRAILTQMHVIGTQSVPIASFFMLLVGMVFALQTGIEFARFGQTNLVALVIVSAMVRELGPWMTAFVLIARVGSSMAAEIGTMKVSEEIDALEVMSVNPISYVIFPRVIGYAVMGPMVTIIGTCVGIAGGALVAYVQLGVTLDNFLRFAERGAAPLDIYWGLLKSFVFSLVAVAVACSNGMRTQGGAVGVGRASRNTVVIALTMTVFFNYLLTSFYRMVKTFISGLA
ncbi:MAG: ABC transporter permease [Planctomycetes bacterium]|nr:ABC transporter permease [Planctomycetota bacterium]